MLRHIINGVHESVLVGFDSFRAIGRKEFCESRSHGVSPMIGLLTVETSHIYGSLSSNNEVGVGVGVGSQKKPRPGRGPGRPVVTERQPGRQSRSRCGRRHFTADPPPMSIKESLSQLLLVIVSIAMTADPPLIVDDFVRLGANVENTTATIARRIVAMVWIVIKHRQYPKTLRHYLPDRTRSTRPF